MSEREALGPSQKAEEEAALRQLLEPLGRGIREIRVRALWAGAGQRGLCGGVLTPQHLSLMSALLHLGRQGGGG